MLNRSTADFFRLKSLQNLLKIQFDKNMEYQTGLNSIISRRKIKEYHEQQTAEAEKDSFFRKMGHILHFFSVFSSVKGRYQLHLSILSKIPSNPPHKSPLSLPQNHLHLTSLISLNPISHPSQNPQNPSKSNDINQRYLNNNLNTPSHSPFNPS